MMSTQCSKHVEVYNKLIIKKRICALGWLINRTSPNVIKTNTQTELLFLVFRIQHKQ